MIREETVATMGVLSSIGQMRRLCLFVFLLAAKGVA